MSVFIHMRLYTVNKIESSLLITASTSQWNCVQFIVEQSCRMQYYSTYGTSICKYCQTTVLTVPVVVGTLKLRYLYSTNGTVGIYLPTTSGCESR